MKLNFKFTILFFLVLGCSQKVYFVKKEALSFGIKFFIFVEEKSGQKFNGRGEGILSENSFKCNIYDNFFDRLLATILFKIGEETRIYVYNDDVGYSILNEELSEIFTRDFYLLFKNEVKEGFIVEKRIKDVEKDYLVKCKVLKIKDFLPQRLQFELDSVDEKGFIVFDILEAGEIPISINEKFNFSNFYETSNLFEFLRSL